MSTMRSRVGVDVPGHWHGVPSASPPELHGRTPQLPRGAKLADLQRQLHAAATLGQLLARAAGEAPPFCGFERGLVLAVADRRLTANATDAIVDPASDALRRRALAAPVLLWPGSPEAEVVRRAEQGRRPLPSAERPSELEAALSLRHYLLRAIAPEQRTLAILVLDRDDGPVSSLDEPASELFSHLLGLALERLILRARMKNLAEEVRYLTTSARALTRESLDTPLALPSDEGNGSAFSEVGMELRPADEWRGLLSPRELEVTRLMAAGYSNREIAERLTLSHETVKGYVARILRKLNAANRVQAVTRFLHLPSDPEAWQ